MTTSSFSSAAPFQAALATFGIDRLMFSVDYLHSAIAAGVAFLDSLAPSATDRAKLAYGNAD